MMKYPAFFMMNRLKLSCLCGILLAMGPRLGAEVPVVSALPEPSVAPGQQTQVSPFVEFTTVNLYHLHAQLQSQYDSYGGPSGGGALDAPEYGLDVGAELMTWSLTPWTSLAFGFRVEDVLNTLSETGGASSGESNTYHSYLLDGLVGMRWTPLFAHRWTVSFGLFAGPSYANLGYDGTQSGANESGDLDGFGFAAVADLRLNYALPALPGLSLNADVGGRYASFGPLSNFQNAPIPAYIKESVTFAPASEDFSGLIAGMGASYDF